jgi:hypothetical protein
MPILKLHIERSDNQESFTFEKLPNKIGTNAFSLIRVDTCYNIKVEYVDGNIHHFMLKPNKEYIVKHYSIGDAAASTLHFTTNNRGVIVKANKTCCN